MYLCLRDAVVDSVAFWPVFIPDLDCIGRTLTIVNVVVVRELRLNARIHTNVNR